jgi:hypothetical protein
LGHGGTAAVGHPVRRTHRFAAAVAFVALAGLGSPAKAKESSEGSPPSGWPEINPFECYGRYQYATENRTIAEMRHELAQRLEWLDEAGQSDAAFAIKLCVIAKLKARVGDTDAWSYFERSLVADPYEPGMELWAAQYWTGNRGARRQIVEEGERHLYAALAKLEKYKNAGRFREYHAIVEDWTRRELTVLYQMDGVQILPWKAYPQNADGLSKVGLALSSQLRVARDTRDFFFNNEYRQFTAEKAFAGSDLRFGGTIDKDPNGKLNATQIYNIVRAPLRMQVDNRLRIRQNAIGTFDLLHSYLRQWSSQIYNFYDPSEYYHPELPQFSGIQVQEIGLGYERVIPLYPAFDLRIAGSVRRAWRDGIVEFFPLNIPGIDGRREQLNLYEFKPSLSRFFGADKLTINGVWAMLDLPNTIGAPTLEQLRRKVIRAVNFEYGLYQPLVLPTFDFGGLSTYRTPTRGLYFYGGVMEDGEAYGSHQVLARDFYGGIRFEGPNWTDFALQGTYGTNNTVFGETDGRGNMVASEPNQAFTFFRSTFILQRRIRSYDTFPGMPPSHHGFGSDMFNVVLPIFWDKTLTGANDYENVRGGLQIWTKIIGEGFRGATFLVTAGVDYQYFYRIKKDEIIGQLAIRMGWGDL